MSDSLGRPEEPGFAVLNPRHWGGVTEGDGEDVHEGGVGGHHQYPGLLSAGLLAQDVDSEAEQPEGQKSTDSPHAVLEHRPPTNMRPQVSLLGSENYTHSLNQLISLLTSGLEKMRPSLEEDQIRKARRRALSILKGTRRGAQRVNNILSLTLSSSLWLKTSEAAGKS